MHEGDYRELDGGWLRTGPSLLEIGSDTEAWAGYRKHLVSDHQRHLFDMWLDKCDGHQLPERRDFSHLEILPMIRSFYTLEYNVATGEEVHRFVGTAYADAVGYEISGTDFEQALSHQLGYTAEEEVQLLVDIYEKGRPCLEQFQFHGFEKPHQGCVDLTLPVRRRQTDGLGEAIGVGHFFDAESAGSR